MEPTAINPATGLPYGAHGQDETNDSIDPLVSRDETHDSIDPHTGGLTMAAQAKRRVMAEAHLTAPETATNAEPLRMQTLPNPNSMEPVPVEGASKAPRSPTVLDAPPLHVSRAHVSDAPEHPTLEIL